MRKIILLSILASLLAGAANAQGWQRRYGLASENEQSKYITRTADGGFLVRASAGGSDPAFSALWRLDADGDSIWTFSAGPYPTNGGQNAIAEDRALTNGAGEIFSVFYDSLFKFDAGGQKLLAAPCGALRMLGVHTDGVVLWDKVASGDSIRLRKYDFGGTVLWEKKQEVKGDFLDLKMSPDGKIFMLYFETGDFRTRVVVIDQNGNPIGFIHDHGGGNYYSKIAFDEAGNYILYETFLAGQSAQNNTVFLLYASPTGQVLWKGTYLISSEDAVQQVLAAPNGGFILIGSTWYEPVRSPRLYRLDAAGKELWKRSYQMKRATFFADAVANPGGSFVVCGHTTEEPGATGPTDAIVWQFSANGSLLPNILRGRIVRDTLPDCTAQPVEPGMSEWKIKLGEFLAVSDSLGRYEVDADTGVSTLELFPPSPVWQVCPDFETVNFSGTFLVDTLDIPVYPLVYCPQMQVSIGFQRLRRCFENTATVSWCNWGTVATSEAQILVVLPPELDFTTATWPVSQVSGDSLWFDIGYVDVNQCGSFQLKAVVDCDSTELGQALCVEAHIFPDSFCLSDPLWSGASIVLSASCKGDTAVEFHLKNIGIAPSSPTLEYIIIEDQVVLMTAPLSLPPGGEHVVTQHVNSGSLYRLEATQEPLHPGFSMPSVWVEGCGTAQNQGLSLQYPADDKDLFIDIECQPVVGSYDPNDKTAFPEGFGPQHYIEANTDLTYRIRFQNTGTDTAFTVVIRDTLSDWLDPASLRPEAASHPFTWNFSEGNILKVIFDNILLPDSATNEPGSNGFVQFRIAQQKDVPDGNVIDNRAGIYFDFNPPVITNTVFHTIGRDYILVKTETLPPGAPGLTVFPNPFREAATFRFDAAVRGVLSIFSPAGQLVRQEAIAGETHTFLARDLAAGVYFFDIRDDGRLLARGKMVAQ